MRLLGIVGVAAAGVWMAACGDGDAGAIVGDFISWRVAGQGVHARHTQANVEQKFKVRCSRGSSGMTIVIEDPGFKGDPGAGVMGAMRPPGSIEIRNGVPNGTCNVVVKDADAYGSFPISYGGTCGAECTFTGQFAFEGWDFSGTLSCTGLRNTATGDQNTYNLVSAVDDGPVQISVDNCD